MELKISYFASLINKVSASTGPQYRTVTNRLQLLIKEALLCSFSGS